MTSYTSTMPPKPGHISRKIAPHGLSPLPKVVLNSEALKMTASSPATIRMLPSLSSLSSSLLQNVVTPINSRANSPQPNSPPPQNQLAYNPWYLLSEHKYDFIMIMTYPKIDRGSIERR